VFAALGRLVVHHPWRVIVAWLIAAIAIIGLAPKLTATSDEASFLPTSYESIQAQDLQQSAFPHAAAPAAIVVFERQDGRQLTVADSSKIGAVAANLSAEHLAHVTDVQVGPASPNLLIQTIAVQMPPSARRAGSAIAATPPTGSTT
jgi:putative drug exporter of the RND superfamily